MAIVNYVLTQTVIFLDSPFLTKHINGFIGEQWYPFENTIVSESLFFHLTSQLPVKTTPRKLDFVVAQSYVDDFYYRIHIDNLQADLGVVASKQVINFNLWNAYFEPLDLKRIDGLAVGVYFDNHDLPPLTFHALEERTWKLHILPDGDARLNLDLFWRFIGQNSNKPYQVLSKLSGQRVIGFAWAIDWDKGVNESLAWHTDILQSQTGHEQRRSLRLSPRLNLDVNVLLHDRERTLFDLTMTAWASKNFVIPVWFYQAFLTTQIDKNSRVIVCNTADIPYADFQYVMLIGDTFHYEVAEVQAVNDGKIILKRPLQNDWQHGTQFFPAVSAFIRQQPQLSKRSSQAMRTNVSFQALDGMPLAKKLPQKLTVDEFNGYPVLTLAPNESDDLTHSYQRLQQQLDNLSGRPLLVDSANANFMLYQYRWFLHGVEQHQQFYSWLNLLNGRQKAVWLPTFSDDLILTNAIQSASKTFDVAYCGYTKFGQGQNGRQHIIIKLKNGQNIYQKIISAQELNGIERLTTAEPFTQSILPSDVISIEFMTLCRLNSDTVNIVHHNDIQGLSTVEMVFRGVRED